MLSKSVIIFFVMATLTACSSMGMPGSPLWMATTDPAARQAYFDVKADHELCILWQSGVDRPQYRIEIANTLKQRGENPMKCHDPVADQQTRQMRLLQEMNARSARQTQQNQTNNQGGDLVFRCGSIGRGANFVTGNCM